MSRVTTTTSLLPLCHVMVRVLLLAQMPAACVMIDNPQSCELHPDESECLARCESDTQCDAPKGVCDLGGTDICVQCTPTKPEACTGATPVCVANQCQKCTTHAQCTDSNVCLPDGTCADEGAVAYVAPGGGGTTCTKILPCGTLADGVNATTAIRPYVKLEAGTVADSNTTTIDGLSVTILADPGAKLSRTMPGVILEVQNDGADVRIFDLEITNGTGMGTPAISVPSGGAPKLTLTRATVDGNQGLGISVFAGILTIAQSTISNNTAGGISNTGGTLAISQSTISDNTGGGVSTTGGMLTISQSTITTSSIGSGISTTGGVLTISRSTISENSGGGIAMAAAGTQFDITNSFIFRNGNSNNAATGGASLAPATGVTSRFEFNTVVENGVINGGFLAGGVACGAIGFSAPNNIIARNFTNGDATQANSNTNGACTYPTSSVSTAVTLFRFVSSENVPYDYHIMAGSSAIGQATTPSTVTIDFDGDVRAPGKSDQGADEFHQ